MKTWVCDAVCVAFRSSGCLYVSVLTVTLGFTTFLLDAITQWLLLSTSFSDTKGHYFTGVKLGLALSDLKDFRSLLFIDNEVKREDIRLYTAGFVRDVALRCCLVSWKKVYECTTQKLALLVNLLTLHESVGWSVCKVHMRLLPETVWHSLAQIHLSMAEQLVWLCSKCKWVLKMLPTTFNQK